MAAFMSAPFMAILLGCLLSHRRQRNVYHASDAENSGTPEHATASEDVADHEKISDRTEDDLGEEGSTDMNEDDSDDEESSDQPCFCRTRQGCCCQHNSTRYPNRNALDQPGHSRHTSSSSMPRTGCPSQATDANSGSETLLDDSEAEELPLDVKSALTLVPIHRVIAFHLSLDNLSCIRRRLDPNTKIAFIPELYHKDTATSDQRTGYYWSNEIYFRKGRFLQKQEISGGLSEGYENPAEHFTGCPHQSLSVATPTFTTKNGLLQVQTWVTNYPPRCPSHSRERWSNSQGPYSQVVSCTICHSDAECVLKLEHSTLYIRYTCYRDLGPGTDPDHYKWTSLLTGEGVPYREEYKFDVFTRVWNTAHRELFQAGLHEVTHQTPNGVFNVKVAADAIRR